MRICFINPWNIDEEGVAYSEQHQSTYWRNAYFGFVELATYIRSKGHDVKIIDAQRDLLMVANGSVTAVLEHIRSEVLAFAPDVVGVTGMTCMYPTIGKILHALTPLAAQRGFKLILGGHHARSAPEACLEDHPELDCIFYGMAEYSLEQYLNGVDKAEVSGIYYRKGEELVRTPLKVIPRMDALPWPDWDLLDPAFYTHPCIWLHRSRETLVRNLDTIVSRGCTFSCSFCGMSGWVGRPQWRSVDSVIGYLRGLQEKYGINATMFQDSSLGNNRQYLEELCERFIESELNKTLIWNANIRANQIDVDLAKLMLRAGCRMVFVGFESASDSVLKAMHKQTTVEDNRNCARALEEAKLPYWASFIAGFPGETAEDLNASLEFARTIDPIGGWANEFNPTPGTRIYTKLLKEGKLVKPTSHEGWAAISKVGEKGGVYDGQWSDMDPITFRKLTDPFQGILMEKLEKGMSRKLLFTE